MSKPTKCKWCGKKMGSFHACEEWIGSDECRNRVKYQVEMTKRLNEEREAKRERPIFGTPEYETSQLNSRINELERRIGQLEDAQVRKEKGDHDG